jgi:hypothetical protein
VTEDRHNSPEVVASDPSGGHNFRKVVPILTGGVVAVAAAVVEFTSSHSVLHAAGALLAGAIAAAIAWFVTTLPGLTLRGLVTGGFFVLAGIVSWTAINHGWLVWPVLAVEGVVFAVWSWPWLRRLRELPRLGTAWLGLAYWLLGIVGAVLAVHLKVGVQRVAYAGVFGLAVLAIVASARPDRKGRRGQDLSIGIAAAFLLALAVLTLSGSGNLFEKFHAVPDSQWGVNMNRRFWGGPWLLYHPNSMALIGVAAALRIGVDRVFAVWQRIAVTVLAGAVIFATNSRSGFVFLGAAGLVHAYLLWRKPGGGLPSYRRIWIAAVTPFAVLALVLVLSGGQGFLFKARYGAGDVTSGRLDTWKQVGTDWVHGSVVEKLFGDTKTSRAVVHRANDGTRPGTKPVDLTTDNAAVGALRRGGVLGEIAFLLGLGLLLWHAGLPLGAWTSGRRRSSARGGVRRAPPAWLTVAAVGSIPTIAVADWLLGGTGGTLWILLVAGEAWLVLRAADPVDQPAPAGTASALSASSKRSGST